MNQVHETSKEEESGYEWRNKAGLAAEAAASLRHMEQLAMAVILAQQKTTGPRQTGKGGIDKLMS